MKSFRKAALILTLMLAVVAANTAASAQTFTKLVDFNGTNGAGPLYDSLVQGRDGNLYGPTSGGGVYGYGTVFRITPGGTLTTLYSFCAQRYCPDGKWPYGGLVLATNGNFYGTTEDGGDCGDCDYTAGTVFKITPEGKATTLYNFDFYDGAHPTGALVEGSDGNFYGTTREGGDEAYDYACGTVFGMTPQGELWRLTIFYCGSDEYPIGGVIQATDGSFYGTTMGYGGSVFKITPRGTLTWLHSFDGADGFYPEAALIQATDGKFYGTTEQNGTFGCGTIFRVAPNGRLITLHNFDGTDGCYSHGSVLQATDGNLYGTTSTGGANNHGTVFEMTKDGRLTTLHSFQGADGDSPVGGLVQATDGKLYGTTSVGGAYGDGTIFSLDLGFSPLVRLVRNVGQVGQTGDILGQGFTGTTDVSLNGTPATFTVVSDTYLTATIPAGATTGFVTVSTPSGTLTSNKIFRVTPQLLSFDPPNGPVGTVVTITGVSLTQTTGVGFGDYVPANFTVNSDTQVTATVPTGARTGRVGVQTSGGTAISSIMFAVTP